MPTDKSRASKKDAVRKNARSAALGFQVSESQLTRLLNTVAKRYTGLTLQKGKGKYQAVCNSPHGLFGDSWIGPCRPALAAAKQDAKAHNAANPGHAAFALGPLLCIEDDATV
jgi:hypothetical protein